MIARAGAWRPPAATRYDVVIAGARAAGAATALLLARRGLRVLVVDPARRGSDTLSTHALMRAGVIQLHRWGLLDRIRQAGTPVVTATTFYYGAEAVTVPVEPKHGVDGLYAPRRTLLDATLVDAAEDAGAEVRHGLAVSELVREGGRVRGAVVRAPDGRAWTIHADLVVGADGLRSRVARLVEAPASLEIRDRTASIYGHFPLLGVDGYHWYFDHEVAMGAIPTNGGDTCVFASVAPARLLAERDRGLDTLFMKTVRQMALPGLARRLARVLPQVRLRAFAGATSFLRQPWGPGWALVGDAGYFKDPLTAHGITDALRDAELLARAIADGGDDRALEGYRETRDELSIGLMRVTARIASLDWSLGELADLHRSLSDEMRAEARLLRAWDRQDATAT